MEDFPKLTKRELARMCLDKELALNAQLRPTINPQTKGD